uniref:Uncharacterized protein n=1 Tax=Anopheles atroparvus TaxID=41427 RepID=A0A182J8A5_ANOAO
MARCIGMRDGIKHSISELTQAARSKKARTPSIRSNFRNAKVIPVIQRNKTIEKLFIRVGQTFPRRNWRTTPRLPKLTGTRTSVNRQKKMVVVMMMTPLIALFASGTVPHFTTADSRDPRLAVGAK